MANTTLQMLFGKYLQSIKAGQKEFRAELNKEANHFFEQDVKALKSQISLVNAKVEIEFNKKYAQALQALQNEGMSNVTFRKISESLKTKFLDHFTDLKELGIDAGHVFSNLTIASKQKAQTELFEGTEVALSEYSQVQLTPKNLEEISKTIALISSYTGALEELDKIQDRKSLIAFLKKAPSFKQYAKSANLTTLEDIKNAIATTYKSKDPKSKGLAELAQQLFNKQVASIKVDTTLNLSRKITASENKTAVTFEIRAVNQFKGQIASNIKNAFTNILQNVIDKDEFSDAINDALTKAIQTPLTKEEFKQIFPNTTGSKTLIQVLTDIVSDNIQFGKSTNNYSAKSKTPNKTIYDKSKINLSPVVKLKKPKIKAKASLKVTKQKERLNLTNIQNIINTLLHQQIRQNMGDGNRRDVLNYRTGRFAQSATVERITQGREGMISAYYTYMKYPYATFSEGGQQEFPRSRDPKLLISKSIREIMQQQMITRMRAVLI